MSIPSFGRSLEEETGTEVEFGRPLKEVPEKSSKKFRPVAYGKAALRGLGKAAISVQDIAPSIRLSGPISTEFQESVLQKYLEDPEAGFTEKTIERAAETAPFLLGGEGALAAKLGRAGLAALLGQSTEELGGGPIAQTAAEVVGLGLPGLRKKIVPKKAQQETVKMLRKRGLSEKEIAPLIPSERKSALLGKVGARGFRTKKAAQRTKDSLGNLYSQLAEEGEKLPILSSNRASLLQSQLSEKLEKMPSSIRRAIQEDLTDLFQKPVKANNLMNFWQDINSQINWKSVGGGKNRLNSLKSVLLEGMEDISPELARDFELTNQQFSNFSKLYKNLKPQSLDRWMALGEAGMLIGGLFKYGPKAVIGVIGAEGVRHLSTEMLVNPRLQNLSKQMVTALNSNKIAIAKKIQEKMIEELRKKDIDLTRSPLPDEVQESDPSPP